MKPLTILIVILCFCSVNNAQVFLKREQLSDKQTCAYQFVVKEGLVKETPGSNSFYFLEKDSLLMLQVNYTRSDTIKLQVHLVLDSKAFRNCGQAKWKVKKVEHIVTGVYRGNPVLAYAAYFNSFDLFGSDFAAVKRTAQWGFINGYGELIIPEQYDQVKPHYFGIWLKNNKGTKIFSLRTHKFSDTFDDISITAPRIRPHDVSLSSVMKAGRMGMMNEQLKILVPPVYTEIRLVSQAFLVGNRNRKFVLLSPFTGKEISPLYDKIRPSRNGDYLEVAQEKNGTLIISKIDPTGRKLD